MILFLNLSFQVDAEGYLNTKKVTPFIKANKRWSQIFENKDDLINRCLTFANSFSKGKLI